MHIEHRLTSLIGQAGKKLHTGRSRNDQVAQDVRLFIRDETNEILNSILQLLGVILEKAKQNKELVMPGYTHLQVAQPIRTSHYLLAYFWAFERDFKQLKHTLEVNDILVLGSGALAGVNYNTDRNLILKELGLPSTFNLSNKGNVTLYFDSQNVLISSFVPGSCPPKSLHGNASTSNPLSLYC